MPDVSNPAPLYASPFFEELVEQGEFGLYADAARHLRQHGFVVVDLGRERIQALSQRIQVDLTDAFDIEAWRAERSAGGLRVQDAWQTSAAVRQLALLSEISELLQTCWGREPFAFQTLNFPVGTQQHAHSDAVHFHSEPPGFMCGVWVALEDISADAGPLIYYPGSDRLPYLQCRDVGVRQIDGVTPDQTIFHQRWMELLAQRGLEPALFTPRLGQALVWTANLIHGGSAVDDHALTRWSQVTHYYFKGCRYYTPMLSNWPDEPIAWRQPSNVASVAAVPGDGSELYSRARDLVSRKQWLAAADLLELACRLLPDHASAHHLFGKVKAELGEPEQAEALQRRSCALDVGLGWNCFALAELLERRQQWGEAAQVYARALAALPQEGWIEELAIRAAQRQVLGGEDLCLGLGPKAYRHWCEQLEPRFPSELVPVRQPWWMHAYGEERSGALPLQGWLVVLGPGCVLRPRALQALEAWLEHGEVSREVQPLLDRGEWLARRNAPFQPDLLTADEDCLDPHGVRCDPWFKPAALYEAFWAQPWLQGLSIWRCSWLSSKELSWPPAKGVERLEWLWSALALEPSHAHLPAVLMHQRADAPPADRAAQARSLRRYLQARGETVVDVEPDPARASGLQIRWLTPPGLRCTAIVPTRNRAELLQQCLVSVESSLANSAVALDWIVVDNASDQPQLAACLADWKERLGARLRVLRDDRPFNWSALNNTAAQHSDADLLLFLNNDIEAVSVGWLERMAAQAVRPAVGCVGARLLYPDGTLQHAGVVVGLHGGADHAYRSFPIDHPVHRGRSGLLSDWGAVTGAALMVRRTLFEQFGGFDPQLPVEFNDVDFCLRLGQQGYRHLIDPAAVLVHHESQSRDAQGSSTAAEALRLMQRRWGGRMSSTAPWWPQACSAARTDGRPRELEWVA